MSAVRKAAPADGGLAGVKMSDKLRALCVPMSSIKLWEKNPRKNDVAAKQLAELIKIHGWRKPIIVDQQGIIRAGNTAYKAAKLLGMTVIPALDDTFASETAAVAYGIADNKAGEAAAWDDAILRELLQADDVLKDRRRLGFTDGEFNEIMLKPRDAGDTNPEGYVDSFTIKVVGVVDEHKDRVVKVINEALQKGGYDYEAAAY